MQELSRLVNVLTKTRDRLISGEYRYFWHKAHMCSAGLIARTALDLSFLDFWTLLANSVPKREIVHTLSWQYLTRLEQKRCVQTGLPLNAIFQALQDIGIGSQGIQVMESLGQEAAQHGKGRECFINFLDRHISYYTRLMEEQNAIAIQKAMSHDKAVEQPSSVKVRSDR